MVPGPTVAPNDSRRSPAGDNSSAASTFSTTAFRHPSRSLATGSRQQVDPDARSICDALQAHTPGELTFQINRRLLDDGIVVSDAQVCDAMRFAFRHLKLVVEPGGAVALAAVLSGKLDTTGKTIAIVLSGGNVDSDVFAAIQRGESG